MHRTRIVPDEFGGSTNGTVPSMQVAPLINRRAMRRNADYLDVKIAWMQVAIVVIIEGDAR